SRASQVLHCLRGWLLGPARAGSGGVPRPEPTRLTVAFPPARLNAAAAGTTGPEGHIARHVTRQTGRQTRRSARPVRDPSLIGYSPGYQTSRPRWGRRSVSEGDRTPPVPNRLREHRLARGLDQWAVAERINALTEDGTPLDEKAVSR